MWTRRRFGKLLALPLALARGQGIATRNVKPMARGKTSGAPFPAKFTDVAHVAGLRAPVICGPEDHKTYVLETVGCGAAFIDYDQDGWLDIFLLSGSRMGGAPEATNRLYNNDGFDDLFVTCWGQNVLYRNNGDGTFTDVTAQAGLQHPKTRWGSGCTFVDYDRNGLLDLFVANYLEFDPASVPLPGHDPNCSWKGIPVHC